MTALVRAVVCAGAVALLAATPSAPTASNANVVAIGDAAPVFSARSLETGHAIGNADFAGKILVVNFWATWCPPCRAETPDMIRAYRSLHAKDVAFLGIDTTEVASVVKTFVSAKGIPYPTALAGPEAYNGFGVAYIPTTVVVDAHGFVRARWTGQLTPERLAKFVSDARAGKNYELDTPDQAMVARLLDTGSYRFDGDPNAVKAEIQRAASNISTADAFAGAHADPKDATVDYARVQTLEGELMLPAARAFARIAASDPERVAADRMLAAADGKLDKFADAVAALEDAKAHAPGDPSVLLDIAKADYRLHDYSAGIAAANAYVKAVPQDPAGYDWLALSEQRAAKFADAAPAYERALAGMRDRADAAESPDERTEAVANVADTSLDLANVYVALGDVAGATRAFASANSYGDRLDPAGPYADLYRNVHERTQEGLIAVRLARGGGKTALSVVPWTGPDLPGSVASTMKYRLIVASKPNAKVDLRALGLRPHWVASFCADGLCSPGRVSVALPDSGVKTYEFQLVPPTGSRSAGRVTIRSQDGVVAFVTR